MIRKALSARQVYERSITEEDVFSACRALLELNGARVFRIVERIPWGRKTSEPGLPDSFGWWPQRTESERAINDAGDVAVLYPPLPFFIEFKKPGGKIRPAQIAWIEAARRDGVVVFCADSVESMVARFKEYGIEIKGIP